MKVQEHLLVCIGEECAEIAQDIAKALRFGINDTNPKTKNKNSVAISKELNDLLAVVEMSINEGLLHEHIIYNNNMTEEKKKRVMEWMEHAKKNGTLIIEENK